MRIKLSSIKDKLIYILVFYMLNKNLCDYFLGSFSKTFYYALILFGFVLYTVNLKKDNKKIIVSFLLYAVIAAVIGFTKSNSDQLPMGLMEYLVYPLAFFALSWFLNGRKDYSQLIDCIYIWGIVTSFLTIFEYVMRRPILPTNSKNITIYYDGTRSYRAAVFIGSPMILAVLLGVILILAFYRYHFYRKRRYIPEIILLLIAIVCTGSRAPLVGTIAGVLFMYYYLFKVGKAKRRTILLLFTSFIIASFLVIVITLFPDIQTGNSFIDYAINRFSSTFNFSSEWGNIERITRWTYYLNVFIRYPFAGIGLATTSAEVLSNINVTAHGITTESGLIARLVETGIIGTLSYYIFFFICIRIALKNIKNNIIQGRTLQLFTLGVVVLFVIEDLVLQISLDIFATFILWLMLALSINLTDYWGRREKLKI